MKDVLVLEGKIRDLINEPRKQNLLLKNDITWNTLCTSLDVTGDTAIALDSYMRRNEEEDTGYTYIIIYGVLQALFLQQDAIKYIAKALDYPFEENTQMKEIREIRNDSIGHPIRERHGRVNKFSVIDRSSMNIKSFTLLSYLPQKTEPI